MGAVNDREIFGDSTIALDSYYIKKSRKKSIPTFTIWQEAIQRLPSTEKGKNITMVGMLMLKYVQQELLISWKNKSAYTLM